MPSAIAAQREVGGLWVAHAVQTLACLAQAFLCQIDGMTGWPSVQA